jgi:glycosyltransferase involved in cell wall biosynthesis
MLRDVWEQRGSNGYKLMLVVTTLSLGGGAEAQVIDMALGLKRRGWAVEIVSLLDPEPPVPNFAGTGIRVHSLGMRRGVADPCAVLRLRAIVKQSRPDVVHSHMTHANLLARAARPFARMPVLINTLHGYKMYSVKSNSSALRELAHRATDRLSDMTTVVCQAAADRYAKLKVAPKGKLLMMPNGIRTATYKPNAELRAEERRKLNLQDEFVWLAAGRLEMVKDYESMLRAFASALDSNPWQTLLIAGEGSLREALEQSAHSLGIGDNVRFLGYRSDVCDLMRAADAFVLSSIFEGMPLALLEAGASELPIVATRVGGNAETMVEGKSGFLVPARNHVELGRAMRSVVTMTEEERHAMGREGGAFVRGKYCLDVILDQWEELYGKLMVQPAESLATEAV